MIREVWYERNEMRKLIMMIGIQLLDRFSKVCEKIFLIMCWRQFKTYEYDLNSKPMNLSVLNGEKEERSSFNVVTRLMYLRRLQSLDEESGTSPR